MAIFHSCKKLLRAIRDGDEALAREHLANTTRLAEFLGPLDGDHYTALHAAAEHRRGALCTLLLDLGADVNARTRAGRTPLMLAAKHKNTDIAELLLLKEADPKAVDNDGLSVFGYAVYHQRPDMAQMMLDRGAEINDGHSFIRACSNRDVPTLKMLIDRGADTKVTGGSYSYHPIHYFAMYGCIEGFNLLLAANGIADIDARLSSDGNTALHMAAIGGHVGMVEALLAAGARRDLENNEGLTAEAAALKKDKRATANILRAAQDAQKPAAPAAAPADITAGAAARGSDEWIKIGDHAVAHVMIVPEIGRRLTALFNFQSRERLMISENMNTGAESTLPPQGFDDVESAAIDAAETAFVRAGGTLPDITPGKQARKQLPSPGK